jgi:hypothetical protein
VDRPAAEEAGSKRRSASTSEEGMGLGLCVGRDVARAARECVGVRLREE